MLKIFALVTLSFGFAGQLHAQGTSGKEESPWEKFERKGGRSVHAKISIAADYELTAPQIAEGRNLQLYDQGGHLDCRNHVPGTERKREEIDKRIDRALEPARAFIWKHWHEKKRGYIRLTFDSVDALSTAHILIEPDDAGQWQIVWSWVRDSGMVDTLPVIRRLEQEARDKGKSTLIFKDADGEEWKRL
jgi:hypothetical protein